MATFRTNDGVTPSCSAANTGTFLATGVTPTGRGRDQAASA
jgi:hypothetical protein